MTSASAFSMFDGWLTLGLKLRPADQPVSDALVTALVVIVSRVLGDGANKRVSPQKDHLVETL